MRKFIIYSISSFALSISFASFSQSQVGQIKANGALLYGSRAVATYGNYAVVASAGSNAIEIVDLSNPATPTHLSSLSSGPNPHQFDGVSSLAISGNTVFAVTAPYLTAIDISNPLTPVVLSSSPINQFQTGGNAAVFLSGKYAYITNGGVFMIFDISNPASPIIKGNFQKPQVYYSAIAASGNYAYLGTYDTFYVIDVSDPLNPSIAGSLANGTGGVSLQFISSIAVSGNYAYVTSGNSNSVQIIDVSNPASPGYAGSIADGQQGALLQGPRGIDISGNLAYVVSYSSNSLEILDITSPTAPAHKASVSDGQGGAVMHGPYFVRVSNNLALITSSSNALEVIDISTPGSPAHKGSIVDGAGGNGAKLSGVVAVAVSGNYAYVQSIGSSATEVIDISNPTAPAHVTSLSGSTTVTIGNTIVASGNFIYVAMTNSIEVVDVSNPASPVIKGVISDGQGGAKLSQISGIAVSGNYLYAITLNSQALEIVDISNPSSPTHAGSITNGTGGALLVRPWGIVVSGNYAYVIDFGSGAIEIIDVSSPSSPVHATSIADGQGGAMLNGVWSIASAGNYLYVIALYSSVLEIIDVSNPLAPSHAASLPLEFGGDIAVAGNYAFMAIGNLEVFDISDPLHPLQAGMASGSIGNVAVQGSYAYGVGDNSLQIFSIFSPTPAVSTPASAVTSSGFTANWNAVGGVTGYQVDVSTDNFNTTVTGYNGAAASGTSLSITGLTENTSYQYRVRSVNANGSSLNSNIISVTTPLAAPLATASSVDSTSFIANWNAVAGASSYQVDLSTDDFSTLVPGYNSVVVSGISLAITGVAENKTYQFRVRAKNVSSTSENSNTAVVTTVTYAPVAKPASPIGVTSFIAHWNAVSGATEYQLDVSSDNFNTFISGYASLTVDSTAAEIVGLKDSTNYKYRVRAVNAGGPSGNSNVIQVITNPKQTQAITFTLSDIASSTSTVVLKAKSSSGLAVSYSSSDTLVAKVRDSTLTVKAAGKCTITASQIGNVIYKAASSVSQTICIIPPKPAITPGGTSNLLLTSSVVNGNQWFLNGVQIPNATAQTYLISLSGAYTVQVGIGGCQSAISDVLVVTGDIAVSSTNDKIHLYPNPAKEFISISVENSTSAALSMQVFDLLGRSVDQFSQNADGVISLNIAHYRPGCYIVRIEDGGGIHLAKFIKD